jgi:hypothetical protein
VSKILPGSTIVLLLLWLLGTAAAGEADSPVPTNLRIFQTLGSLIADSAAQVVARPDSPRVSVNVAPSEFRWFMDGPVADAFRARGCRVVAADSARFAAEFGALAMRVSYTNVRRPGFFSARIVDRSVRLAVSLRVTERSTGALVVGGERAAEYADTVELSAIDTLETPWVPVTRGTLPAEGFFSGWAEPLIVIGSIAVAIYLLFTVRS